MLRLSLVLYGLVGTVLIGICIMIVLAVPTLSDRSMTLIPMAALIGALVAAPVTWLVARAILLNGRRVVP
ncbi:MAG: hypothetical protein JWM36_3103 [Hyphomicrobiales bacterium]|nr:hypothetical protein [Hyphomicrobiales bacterium]